MKDALRPVRRLYGATAARAFGPLALRAVRDLMIRGRLARTTINARIGRIRRAFKWAASVEMIPAGVVEALCRPVDGLPCDAAGPRPARPSRSARSPSSTSRLLSRSCPRRSRRWSGSSS